MGKCVFLNLYGHFIQIASDPKRWWIHTLTDHVPFSFQDRVFVPENKQGAVRGFEVQGGLGERSCNIPALGS